MFSVSTVPSKIEPEKKTDDHYMEYFEELNNEVARRKDGHLSNETDFQKP